MKTIKIFGLPSHQTEERTSGVDFARVIQPMKHLNGYVYKGYKFKVDLYDIFKQKETNWQDVSEKYDAVFMNYTAIDWAYAAMGAFVHGKGKKIIFDLDDALWHINPDNIAHDALKKVNGGFITTQMIRDVDGVVTTNSYLRNVIHKETGKSYDLMTVIPNAVDFELYNHKSPAKDSHTITLYHYGSTSHFNDLLRSDFVEGVTRIFADYPNVVFKATGANIPKLKARWGERYSYGWGDSDIYRWVKNKFPGYMDEADIMVVPLSDNLYNRCKSSVKFLESATAMKPGVFSRIRPYEEHVRDGETGYLASSAQEWYDALKRLIDSKEERQRIGMNAYNEVKFNHTIERRLDSYADFILRILEL